ncbi:MAG: hypothetical protein NW203_07575 [Hyphomonadaceae bacterium]|nr:hypothetical protein [Hyphomonadaceae bacterium]
MGHILLAHAPGAAARAAMVSKKLQALGYAVRPAPLAAPSPLGRRETASAVAGASRVVLLWSADAARDPSLLAAAARAQAAGKLAVARLDAAAPPAGLSAAPVDLSRWTGRADWRPWRAFVAALGPTPAAPRTPAPRPAAAEGPPAATAAPEPAPAKRGGGALVVGVILALLAAGGAAAFFLLSPPA